MPVYFIQDEGGEVKIGYSDGNPYKRLNTFKTGNPRELTLLVSIPGGREEEQALHQRFTDLKVKGEWFKPDARLLGFIDGMKYAYRDRQPEPIDAIDGDEDSFQGLSFSQMQVCAGYAMAYEAVGLAHGYARISGPGRASIELTRRYLASRLRYLGQLSPNDDALSEGIRAVLDGHRTPLSELIDALLAEDALPCPETH